MDPACWRHVLHFRFPLQCSVIKELCCNIWTRNKQALLEYPSMYEKTCKPTTIGIMSVTAQWVPPLIRQNIDFLRLRFQIVTTVVFVRQMLAKKISNQESLARWPALASGCPRWSNGEVTKRLSSRCQTPNIENPVNSHYWSFWKSEEEVYWKYLTFLGQSYARKVEIFKNHWPFWKYGAITKKRPNHFSPNKHYKA